MNDYTLKDLIKINNGKDYRHLSAGNIPVYGSGGIMCYVNEYLFDGECILLPRKGTLDNIMYVTGKFWTVDTMYWVTVNTELADTRYLYLYLTQLDLSNLDTGSALPSMTYDTYNMVPVKLPDINIQREIADRIFAIKEKISNNTAICSELEAMAKLLYDYWFVQFDFPDENGKPYKSSGGKLVWNEELKREIPEGWEVKHLIDCVSKDKNAIVDGPFGTQMKISEYVDSGIPIYEMEQLNGSFIVDEPKHFITETKYSEVQRSTARNGDIIISKTGTLGLLGLVESAYEKGIIVSRLAKITPNPDVIGRFALLIHLKELAESGYWLKVCGGSTMPILNNGTIGSVPVIVPNDNRYQIFEEKIASAFHRIHILQKENQQLALLRDFLLPMLMNGQVTIED